MGKAPSEATQLRTARRELKEAKKEIVMLVRDRNEYRARATKAEQEATDWRSRFDQLLAREPIVTPHTGQVNTMTCPRCQQPWISIPRMGVHHVCPDGKAPTPEDFAPTSAVGKNENPT